MTKRQAPEESNEDMKAEPKRIRTALWASRKKHTPIWFQSPVQDMTLLNIKQPAKKLAVIAIERRFYR